MAKKSKGVNPDLERAISEMLHQVMHDSEASITDKTKVIDRALHLEKIKLKISDEEWGSGFVIEDDDQES
jgi:hypothetical protein